MPPLDREAGRGARPADRTVVAEEGDRTEDGDQGGTGDDEGRRAYRLACHMQKERHQRHRDEAGRGGEAGADGGDAGFGGESGEGADPEGAGGRQGGQAEGDGEPGAAGGREDRGQGGVRDQQQPRRRGTQQWGDGHRAPMWMFRPRLSKSKR
ncbi:hypothetical protein [Actinoplanes xinjiangensis]|uniref:hypothetical protein n=1 Tax=Actinoplanes xinjiangensis TaxID=512350 RepID=UPI000D6B6872|nr:hypothetical protein [Actinoplanes xinjiangensis]GIF35877.1 hypothetical protein Axi01nite_01880 [Actinoplanes xinjiangensis]